MKFSLLLLVIAFHVQCFSQAQKPGMEKSSEQNVNRLTVSIFKYPDFIMGKVVRSDGSSVDQKLNYNRILGQILFVDRLGKPTPLNEPETIVWVAMGTDTFYIFNKSVLEKLTHFNKANLYSKESIVFIEKDKSSSTGSPIIITSGSQVPYGNNETSDDKQIEQNSLFKFITDYFVNDVSGGFAAASKKTFYDLFSNYKKEWKAYLHDNSVRFNNVNDMEDLLRYYNSL